MDVKHKHIFYRLKSTKNAKISPSSNNNYSFGIITIQQQQPPTTTTTGSRQVCVALFVVIFGPVVDMSLHGDHGQLALPIALAAAIQHSRDVGPVSYNAPWSQKTARAEATNNALRSLTTSVAGDTENGISGAPWYRLSTVRRSCRRLMFLCRRWRTSWWRCAGSSIFTSPSRLSKCPRLHLHPVILAGAVCVSRSRRRNIGGSAYDRILLFVAWAFAAESGHSSSSRSWRSCRCQRSSRFPRSGIQQRFLEQFV